MPKKTKKQKLQIAARRQALSSPTHLNPSKTIQAVNPQILHSFTYTVPSKIMTDSLIHDERSVKTDIIKTVVLVIVILGIEFLLSRYLS